MTGIMVRLIIITALTYTIQASRVRKHGFFETTVEERARQALVDADNADSMAGEALQWGHEAVSNAVAVGADVSHGAVLLSMQRTAGGPTPMFTKDTMPAVAPALQCVISLTIQYFVI